MTRDIDRPLAEVDPEIARAVAGEERRIAYNLEMIASENFVSEALLAATGSVLTNKYAEGYPGKRYYGGCEYVDVVEEIARDRARRIFECEHVNVQPHSGSQANMAVYLAALDYGDTILGMNLAHGGHLTHGHPLNFSGRSYKIVPYGVTRDAEVIDYDELERLAHEHKPKLILCGASAYSRTIDFERIGRIARDTGAHSMADIAHIAGLVAVGLHPSPIPHMDFVTTTTHKTLRGPRAGMIMCRERFAKDVDRAVFPTVQGGPLMHVVAAKAVCFKEALEPSFRDYQMQVLRNAKALSAALAEKALESAGITVNKNAIPFDTQPPMKASGIRIGTPALTTRGMRETEMAEIGVWIGEVLADPENPVVRGAVRERVRVLCERFPIYENRLVRSRAQLS